MILRRARKESALLEHEDQPNRQPLDLSDPPQWITDTKARQLTGSIGDTVAEAGHQRKWNPPPDSQLLHPED